MKFGIIGCKTIAASYKGALQSLPDATLAGVYDINQETARSFAEGTGAVVCESLSALLESDIDAVCICTPSGLHVEQAVAAAKAGLHIVVEKPIGITTEQLSTVRSLCSEHPDLVLTAISQMTFADDFVRLKELVETGALGRALLCDLSMKYYRSPQYYRDGGWRGTIAMDGGGALMNQGIHGISLMLQLMGPVKSVTAHSHTLLHDIEVEDTAVAVLEFQSGALGSVIATTSVQPQEDRVLCIHGTKGSATLTEDVLSRVELVGSEPLLATDQKPQIAGSELHRRQIANFMDAVKNGHPPLLGVESGAAPVELILAIYESSKRGETIYL